VTNPTQLLVLSQILYWFLSPGPRYARNGSRLTLVPEGDSNTGERTIVKRSHRFRTRNRGTLSEYLEPRYLDTITRRAEGRTQVDLSEDGKQWRWSVTLPYSRWAADTGLSVRQVRAAIKALSTTGWFTLQHNSKREPIIIEGERMRTQDFMAMLDDQANGCLRGTLLLVRNINKVCRGDIIAALVLKEVMRLVRYHRREEVYKTAKQLADQLGIENHRQVERARQKLADIGVMFVDKAKWVGQGNRRYKAALMRVNWQVFHALQTS
jgi:hypothetical protein